VHYRQTRDGRFIPPKRAGKNVSGDAGAYAGGMAPSPEERESQLETLQLIDTMLDGLSGKTREAFLLSQLDGLKYSEIALQLGVSVSSVKKYVAKAIEHCLLFRLEHGL
jgi:RNA polymerase sigma-70 factor (ECF subfamily)